VRHGRARRSETKQNGCRWRLTRMKGSDDPLVRLEQVYRERFGQFVRLAHAITGDGERAREAVQEAFVRAVAARGALRASSAADAWVAQIVVNCARDAARERVAEVEIVIVEELVEVGRVGDQDWLRAAVARLPERQRLALFLRYYADFDYGRIASVLGIEVGTVSATLHAARMGVARLLEEVSS
jgi:RNA polymerase sigma factor (sigma-70 family)